MAPDEYSKALDKALTDLQQRVQQRDILHADIAGLRETVRVLSTMVQMPAEKRREVAKLIAMADYATPSLTDAIRSLLLRVSPQEMTASEVRNALEDSSDYEGISLSACHAALKRMLSDGEIESGPLKNGKASYRRVIKFPEPSGTYGGVLGILGLGHANQPGSLANALKLPSEPNDLARLRDLVTRGNEDRKKHPLRDAFATEAPKAPRPPNWKGGLPAPRRAAPPPLPDGLPNPFGPKKK
jgi:hypothetical protein